MGCGCNKNKIKIPKEQKKILEKIYPTVNGSVKSNKIKTGLNKCPKCRTVTVGSICPICANKF